MKIRKPSSLNLRNAIPRKLKWGVAGCGAFAENSFLPAAQIAQRSKVVSLFSRDINRAKFLSGKFGVPFSFSDYEEFLKSDIDAVYISSVNADHHWQVIKAANAGKHILCERPVALNSTQASEMIDACKQNNVQFVINYLHRFHPLVQKAKELVDKQLLGKIFSVAVSYNIDFAPAENFRFNKELSGGGVLRDIGSQVIDALRYFGGEITEVKAYMDNIVYKSEVEDFAAALVKFEKSGYGQFNVSYTSKKPSSIIDVFGYNGSLSIESMAGKKGVITNLIISLPGEARKVFRKRGNKMLYMIRSVQKSFLRNEPIISNGEDSLTNMLVIEKIEKNCS